MPYYHYMDHGDGGWSAMGIIWMILLAVLVIIAIVALVRWGFGGGFGRPTTTPPRTAPPEPTQRQSESPLEMLDRRLASGEISVEDYRERREILSRGGGETPSEGS